MRDRESYFAEAERLVSGDRQVDYGHPIDNHTETGAAWSAYLRRRFDLPALELDAEDVCMLNVLQKVIRDANSRKRDNRVDAIGYLRNVEMIEQERARRAAPIVRILPGGKQERGSVVDMLGGVRRPDVDGPGQSLCKVPTGGEYVISHGSTKETERSLDTRRFDLDETAGETYDPSPATLGPDARRVLESRGCEHLT